MSVTVILEAEVKQGQKDNFLTFLSKLLPETHKFKGFIDITIYSEENTDLILFISKWESFAIYQQYLQWRCETGDMASLGEFLQQPPKFRQLSQAISDELTVNSVD